MALLVPPLEFRGVESHREDRRRCRVSRLYLLLAVVAESPRVDLTRAHPGVEEGDEAVYVRVAAAHSLPAVRHARVRRRRQQARRCAGTYGEALRSADAAHRLDESRAAAFKHPHEATSFGRSEGYKLPPLRLPTSSSKNVQVLTISLGGELIVSL